MKQVQYNKIQKIGERIGINELLQYLKTNKDVIQNIGCIDLNSINTLKTNTIESITKLQFQDLKKINYLPENLANIFGINLDNFHKYLHAGVLQYISHSDGKKINVSLYSSILVCLKHTFLSQQQQNQELFITKLLNRLKTESIGTKFKFFEYDKLGWNKENLKMSIINGNINPHVIKFVSDYLCINIFILDIQQDKVYFPGDEYISHRKHIFLLKYPDNTYEPCFTEQSRTFTLNDIMVKNLMQHSKKINTYILLNNFDKNNNFNEQNNEFHEIYEDLTKYVGKSSKWNKNDPIKNITDKTDIKKLMHHEVNSYDDSINAYDDMITDTQNDVSHCKLLDIENDTSDNNHEKKPKKINKKETSQNDTSSKKYKISDIKTTLKIAELQTIAKNLKISTEKNGKAKIKKELLDDIKTKLSK